MGGIAGIYGVAAHRQDEFFVGLDLGDQGAKGRLARVRSEGRLEAIVSGLTRPRQLAIDGEGRLVSCTESPGRILRWDGRTGGTVELAAGLQCPQGVAPAADGLVYFSEYGDFTKAVMDTQRPKAGRVGVVRPDGRIETIVEGIWRARGLALHPRGLIVASEADREDHGNSGQLLLVDVVKRTATAVLTELDYPQFPCVAPDGEVCFTLARDNWLVRWHPDRRHPVVINAVPDDCRLAVCGGNRHEHRPEEARLRIRVESVGLEVGLDAQPGAPRMSGWLYLPVARFHLRTDEPYPVRDAEHPCPGFFETPAVSAFSSNGRCRAAAIAVRSHVGCRWPMTNPGTPHETAAPGFDEKPRGYLVYFDWQDNRLEEAARGAAAAPALRATERPR